MDKSRFEPPHSPFGTLYEIADCGVWTLRDILYRMPWQTVMMMNSDRAKFYKAPDVDNKEITDEEEAEQFLRCNKYYRKAKQ